MAGNVSEWLSDWYDFSYYQYCVDNGIVNDPPGPASGWSRVVRGGNWSSNPLWGCALRVAMRGNLPPDYDFFNTQGFRCAQ